MQRGPGAENAFGGVAQGFADNIPFLVLPGGHERTRFGVHPAFDSISHYKGITKWSGYVNDASRIPEMFRSAFTQMKHGRPGPTMIETPSDVAEGDYPGDLNYRPVKVHRSSADPDQVRDIVAGLLKASSPMMYVGQGVHFAEAYDELIEFAELTHIPVMTTLAGKSAFPENHRLALGTGGNSGTLMVHHYLKKTDFCIGVGTSFTNTNFNAPVPENVPLAQITNAVEDINKDYEIDFGAIGDAKLVLQQMIEEVKRQTSESGRGDVNGVVVEVAKVKAEFMKEWSPYLNSDEVPISPYRVLTELARTIDPDNTIITHDSGYPREQFVPFWPSNKPHTYIGWGKSTQLGYGLGLALGAKLAAPDKQVINVMGDAAFGMAGMDIETAARAKIGIMTVVLNNGVMTHYDHHMPYSTKHHGANALGGDYAKVAEGLGAHVEVVETPDQLAPAIRRAAEANKAGQPALIEAKTKVEETVAHYYR
jgi:acetolactate synthase-1/2/3 large subunit